MFDKYLGAIIPLYFLQLSKRSEANHTLLFRYRNAQTSERHYPNLRNCSTEEKDNAQEYSYIV